MSCEPASVPYSVGKVADGEHPHHGTGAEVSDVHSLSITNPLAIDFEIREELAREKDDNEREKAAVITTSNTVEESCRPKKNKFKFTTCCEWAVIGTVIAVMWGLLMLPTIYYRTPQNFSAVSDPANDANTSLTNSTSEEVGSGSGDSRGTNCTSRMVNDTMMEAGLLVPFEDQNSTVSPMAMSFTCREGFYLDNEIGFCLPECSTLENLPHHVEVITHVIIILAAVVYILSASVLLLLSCLHHKRMFKFPSIFIVYEMFSLGLFEVFVLIAFTDKERLFCSKRDVVGSLRDSTTFCNIQGAVFHYSALQAFLFLLFHILAVFCGIKFPLRAKTFEKNGYFRYAHIVMLAIAIVVPFIAVAAQLGIGGSAVATFPPFQCYARSTDVIYYIYVLPGCIMMGTGITLLILMLHAISRHVTSLQMHSLQEQDLRNQGSCYSELFAHIKKILKYHSGEVKVLIVSVYFAILALFIITTFTIHKVQHLPRFLSDITSYFMCEATGTLRDCDKPIPALQRRILSIVTFSLVGLFPVVNLIFVLNIRELKQKILKHFPNSEQQLSRKRNGTVTSNSSPLNRSCDY